MRKIWIKSNINTEIEAKKPSNYIYTKQKLFCFLSSKKVLTARGWQ